MAPAAPPTPGPRAAAVGTSGGSRGSGGSVTGSHAPRRRSVGQARRLSGPPPPAPEAHAGIRVMEGVAQRARSGSPRGGFGPDSGAVFGPDSGTPRHPRNPVPEPHYRTGAAAPCLI